MTVNNGVLGYRLFDSDISALQFHTSKYVYPCFTNIV